MGKRVALYLRVSTDRKEAFSIEGQQNDLRKNSGEAGHEVVAEIEDRGEKRWTLERPGVEKLRELAAAGEIEEVWAWRWDRFGQSPWPEVLQVELEEYGVTLRSLDDGGEGEDAELLRGLRSLLAKKEQSTRVARSVMGRRSKASRGQLLGTGPKPRYGFRYVKNEKGKNVAYEIEPEQMAVVRSVFEMLASGETRWAVQRRLEEGGVPAPSGGAKWYSSTLKYMAAEDTYLPHTAEELADALTPEVLASLDPGRSYGLAWQGRRSTRNSPMSGKKNRKITEMPKEEWIAVPVDLTGSGLDRETIERARRAEAGKKKWSKVQDRFWPLSGGLLRCAHCARVMHPYRRKSRRADGGYLYYYRCRGTTPTSQYECPNRSSHQALDLERRAWEMVSFEAADPDGELAVRLHTAYVEQRRRLGDGSGARRAAMVEALNTIEAKRHNFWDMGAAGDIPREIMREKIADLEDEGKHIRAELEATKDAAERVEALEQNYAAIMQAFEESRIRVTDWDEPPEARAKRYRRMGITFRVNREGDLEAGWEVDSACQLESRYSYARRQEMGNAARRAGGSFSDYSAARSSDAAIRRRWSSGIHARAVTTKARSCSYSRTTRGTRKSRRTKWRR